MDLQNLGPALAVAIGLVTLWLKVLAAVRTGERDKTQIEARIQAVELRNSQQDKIMADANDRIHAEHDARISNLEDRIEIKLDKLIDEVKDLKDRNEKLEKISIEAITRFESHKERTDEKMDDLKKEDELLHRRISKVRGKE